MRTIMGLLPGYLGQCPNSPTPVAFGVTPRRPGIHPDAEFRSVCWPTPLVGAPQGGVPRTRSLERQVAVMYPDMKPACCIAQPLAWSSQGITQNHEKRPFCLTTIS